MSGRVEFLSGAAVLRAKLRTRLRAAGLALRHLGPRRAAPAMLALLGEARRWGAVGRRVEVAGRTYFHLSVPGLPSRALDRFLGGELRRVAGEVPPPLHLALLAITRRCNLRCAHCSDWESLGAAEALTVGEVVGLARSLAAAGASHLELTGGEPLLRPEAVEAVCGALASSTDVWVLTAGGLGAAAAARLAGAGLTGVVVSLDHWDPARHDAFRGVPGQFDRAAEAVRTAGAAGLVPAVSLVARQDFCGAEDLARYLRLAGELGAAFVRILEPRAVGRWAGRDVALRPAQVEALLRFAREANAAAGALPIVDVPALDQRELGCAGAGDRYLFVDAGGYAHACPFCRAGTGRAVGGDLAAIRERLQARGCHAFPGRAPARAAPVPRARDGSGPRAGRRGAGEPLPLEVGGQQLLEPDQEGPHAARDAAAVRVDQ